MTMTARSLSVLTLVIAAAAAPACKDSAPRATTAAAVPTAAQPATPRAGTQRLAIDAAHSTVGFVGRKVTMQHQGGFGQFSGSVDFDSEHVENSVINVDIDMGSVHIEPDRLLNHLRSPDFFDVARFPHATFVSTSIRPGGENGATHTITGNLSLHGQTRSITFPARIQVAPGEVTATSEFSINRRDFQIVYPGMPDDLIRDDVTIQLNLHLRRG